MTERFTDEAENIIAPQSTWAELSINELIDTKNQLQDKAWAFRNTPQISIVLNRSIVSITQFISERASSRE